MPKLPLLAGDSVRRCGSVARIGLVAVDFEPKEGDTKGDGKVPEGDDSSFLAVGIQVQVLEIQLTETRGIVTW